MKLFLFALLASCFIIALATYGDKKCGGTSSYSDIVVSGCLNDESSEYCKFPAKQNGTVQFKYTPGQFDIEMAVGYSIEPLEMNWNTEPIFGLDLPCDRHQFKCPTQKGQAQTYAVEFPAPDTLNNIVSVYTLEFYDQLDEVLCMSIQFMFVDDSSSE